MKNHWKKILKISASVVLATGASIALFMLLVTLSLILRQIAASPEDLGGGYCVDYDRYPTLGEGYKDSSWSLYDDKMCIRDYATTDTHIFIYAFLAPDDMDQNEIYDHTHMSDREQITSGFDGVFYIVDKEKQDVMGPMDLGRYVMVVDSIGVDDDVRLKVKIEL